ncbi:hypothetical protein K490DRAFT_57585 [Saccharata proteae CBS 121410]|uniref:AAR2 domain-containing protein n=1 Tax=Saccharata proteae CBS 121410 TaxID=1314787 RepID=A0A9P4LW41_9PEZI|nr:hypothetical protein K490DRAFT_57585 [Saccharata proteae CBS 121410]
MDDANKASVLMLNLPPSALGGIDLLSFTTTPRFQGIKHLPPGWHFVFVSSTNSLSVRHGAWFRITGDKSGPPELLIKKWDAGTEDFVAETSPIEVLRWRANLGSIWREGLTPYRQSAKQDETEEVKNGWAELTTHITESLLSRITGSTTPGHWSLTSASSADRDLDDIPGLSKEESKFQPEKELQFLPIDLKQTWRSGATGRERSEAAQDRSWALGEMIEQHCGGQQMEVLGELQFCFLMVLTLNNNSCLEQWKRILTLLFTCKACLTERAELFVEMLALLKLQLQHCQEAEGGLFDLTDEGGALLKGLLRRFRKALDDVSGKAKADIVDELDELEEYLKDEYGWQLDDSFVRRGMLELEDGERVEMDVSGYEEDDESGEYAPMVVELTAAQAEELHGPGPSGDYAEAEDEEEQDLEDLDARY